MTPGQRLREYQEKLECALQAGHGVTCELVTEQVAQPVAKANNISRFLRRRGKA
jgi:hypothetical protein